MSAENWMNLRDAAKHFGTSHSNLTRWLREYEDHFVVKKVGVSRYVDVAASRRPEKIRLRGVETPEGMLSYDEAKEYYDISNSALHSWINEGHLFIEKINNKPYIVIAKSNPPNTRHEPAENWKTVPGFPDYEACRDGRVRSAKTWKVLSPNLSHGYHLMHLYLDGVPKVIAAHRVIAMTFMPHPDAEKLVVDHINRVKTDNRAENLRWATHSENNMGKNVGVVYHRENHPVQGDLPGEVWKPCTTFLGYMVSSEGRVKNRDGKVMSYDPAKALNRYISYKGYPDPTKKDKTVHLYIHREVARAFLPEFSENLVVNHKNGNTHDNRLANLEVVTQGQNVRHAYDTGLNPNRVRIRMTKPDGTVHVFESIDQARIATGYVADSIGYASRNNTNLGGCKWERI